VSLSLPLPESLELAHLRTTLRTWADRITGALQLPPVLRGRLIKVELTFGAQLVGHRLGRVPEGWIATTVRGAAVVYQHDDATAKDLPLTATGAARVTLWVW